MKYEVYVEGRKIDIDPKTVIASTFQSNNIASGDITTRKASYTNQITAPRTKNNIEIFEYANSLSVPSTFPYLLKRVEIYSNGLRTLEGTVMIQSFDGFFNLRIFSMPKDLSFKIGTKMLDVLEFGDSPITWNQAYMYYQRNTPDTNGVISPMINYGQIDASITNSSIGDYNLPSVMVKTIFTQIFTDAGFTVSGDFYDTDPKFNAMILSYGRRDFPGTSFTVAEILPDDVLQSTLLSDLSVKFGLFYRIKLGNVEILKIEDILLNYVDNAIDWTRKRANKKETIEYRWNGWAQRNVFSNPDHEGGENYDYHYIKSGNLLSDNANIELSNDVYMSKFALPESFETPAFPNQSVIAPGYIQYQSGGVTQNAYAATSNVYGGDTLPSGFTFTEKPKPMLLLLRDPANNASPPIEQAFYYNGMPISDYKVAYFAGGFPNLFDGLSWRGYGYTSPGVSGSENPPNGLLDTYYPSVENILQNGAKTITREYLLSDVDINQLDLFIPIFDDGNYFLISKINTWVSGRICQVELMKINTTSQQTMTLETERTSTEYGYSYDVEFDVDSGIVQSVDDATDSVGPTSNHLVTSVPTTVSKTDNGGIAVGPGSYTWLQNGVPVNVVNFLAGDDISSESYTFTANPEDALKVEIVEYDSSVIPIYVQAGTDEATMSYDTTFPVPTLTVTQSSLYQSGSAAYAASKLVTVTKTDNGGLANGRVVMSFLKNATPLFSVSFDNGDTVTQAYNFTGLVPGDYLFIVIDEKKTLTLESNLNNTDPSFAYNTNITPPNINQNTNNGTPIVGPDYIVKSSAQLVTVQKVDNGGVSVSAGSINWRKNGLSMHTQFFGVGATVNYSYNYTGLNPGDVLLVVINE